MATNRDIVMAEGIGDDTDALMDFAGDEICECCNAEVEKNLSPENPACEGRWCDEACDLWLDAEEGTYGSH